MCWMFCTKRIILKTKRSMWASDSNWSTEYCRNTMSQSTSSIDVIHVLMMSHLFDWLENIFLRIYIPSTSAKHNPTGHKHHRKARKYREKSVIFVQIVMFCGLKFVVPRNIIDDWLSGIILSIVVTDQVTYSHRTHKFVTCLYENNWTMRARLECLNEQVKARAIAHTSSFHYKVQSWIPHNLKDQTKFDSNIIGLRWKLLVSCIGCYSRTPLEHPNNTTSLHKWRDVVLFGQLHER